jgi:hypothetical protein
MSSRSLFLSNTSEGLQALVKRVDAADAGLVFKALIVGTIGDVTMEFAKEVISKNQIEGVSEFDDLEVVDEDEWLNAVNN